MPIVNIRTKLTNLTEIAKATKLLVDRGETIFQAYRFGDSDMHHLWRLMMWADLPKDCNLIDMGCGVGAVTKAWSQFRPDISTTLVNLSSEQMAYIDHFKKHICDMTAVPEPDESFDVATCLFAIGHCDQEKALKEMARLVKPDGVVFVFDMVGGNDKIHELSYTVGSREEMENKAKNCGLTLDFYMEPAARNDYGTRILGKDFDVYFSNCVPAIWRWRKVRTKLTN